MKKNYVLILIILVSSALSGCAYNEKITLNTKLENKRSIANIQLVDTRDDGERKTRLTARPTCIRDYGDSFIAPSKMEYLSTLLSNHISSREPLKITINTFKTLEHCDKSVDSVIRSAFAGLGYIVISPEKTYPENTGNYFELKISGEVNNSSFNFHQAFDYNDLRFLNFPSENIEYSTRASALLDNFVEYLNKLIEKNNNAYTIDQAGYSIAPPIVQP